MANDKSQNENTSAKVQPISLRITDKTLYDRLDELSREQRLSLNMTVNMLLGFAFNEVDAQKKKFVSKVVFESK